nr:PREDICTED: uncharacterized protein LOC105676836 [Linepithema humile]
MSDEDILENFVEMNNKEIEWSIPRNRKSNRKRRKTSMKSTPVKDSTQSDTNPEYDHNVKHTAGNLQRNVNNNDRHNNLVPNINRKKSINNSLKDKVMNLKKKVPRTSAISILIEDADLTYAEIIRLARDKISLSDLNIFDPKIKRSIAGGILIEIPGEDSDIKADLLLTSLHHVFKDMTGVRIRKPTRNSQIKLVGLDDSITKTEINNILAEIGKCSSESIYCSPIRFVRGGLGVAMARCPIAAAVNILEAGKINIGWTTVRVEPVDSRPLQCYKCLAIGHTLHRCPESKDRRACCYRCGEIGHRSSECRNAVSCPVCLDRGLRADHMAGTSACKPVPPGKTLIHKTYVNKDNVNVDLYNNSLPVMPIEERRPLDTAEPPASEMDTEI